jgi:hypothetical protein
MRRAAYFLGQTALVLLGLTGAAHAGGTLPPLPEPASITLLAVGAGAIALVKFRKRK